MIRFTPVYLKHSINLLSQNQCHQCWRKVIIEKTAAHSINCYFGYLYLSALAVNLKRKAAILSSFSNGFFRKTMIPNPIIVILIFQNRNGPKKTLVFQRFRTVPVVPWSLLMKVVEFFFYISLLDYYYGHLRHRCFHLGKLVARTLYLT